MKKVIKVIIILVIIFAVIAGITFAGIKFVDGLKEDKEEYNAKKEMDNINANLIIESVNLAYETAMGNNLGVYPTLEQVKENFANEHAKWEEDNKIVSDSFECSVNTDNKLLVVKCLDYQTNNSLKLRN